MVLVGACLLAECLTAPSVLAAPPSMSSVALQASDVPGFSPVPPTVQALNPSTLEQAFRQCAAGNPLLSQMGIAAVSTVSSLYGEGEGPFGVPSLLVGTAVFSDGSTTDAQVAYSLVDSASFQSCWLSTNDEITTAFTSGLATLLSASESSLPPLSLGSNVESTGFTFHITISVFDETDTEAISVTAIHVGAIVTLLITTGTNETFPETLRASIARNIALRMGASPTSTSRTTVKAKQCLRSGIPDPGKPVLTTAQVAAVVKSTVRFTSEATTGGSSLCVWTEEGGPFPSVTWSARIDGPLQSKKDAVDAYTGAKAAATLVVPVPGLGHDADLVTLPYKGTWLAVAAGRYFLEVSTSPSIPSERMALYDLATLILERLHLHRTVGGSLARKHWASDWAGPAFCASNYHQPVLTSDAGGASHDSSFRGVAACGEAHTSSTSNLQGPIWYRAGDKPTGKKIEEFDSTGFQSVEYADRYFYYLTGRPGAWTNGSDVATVLYYTYDKVDPKLGLVPKPKGSRIGGTRKFRPTLRAGDIISMWSSANTTGDDAVVTRVSVAKNGNGKYHGVITTIGENASASGITTITVLTGRLTYDHGYFTTFQWLTGLPGA